MLRSRGPAQQVGRIISRALLGGLHHQYVRIWTRPRSLRLQNDQLMSERGILRLKSTSRLDGKANSVNKKHGNATIVVDVKRFGHQINTDEVFGTHRPSRVSTNPPGCCDMCRGVLMSYRASSSVSFNRRSSTLRFSSSASRSATPSRLHPQIIPASEAVKTSPGRPSAFPTSRAARAVARNHRRNQCSYRKYLPIAKP